MKIVTFIISICVSLSTSAQKLICIDSKYLGAKDSVWVFLPTKQITEAIPAVYLLHSHGADYKKMAMLMSLQALSDCFGFAIICPDGLGTSWFIDSPNRNQPQFGKFLVHELMPEVQKRFSVRPDANFITGVSMGGHGALWLYANYPGYFLSAGSSSGVVNLRHSAFRNSSIAAHLGTYAESNLLFDTFSVIGNIKKLKGLEKTFIFDCGTEDYLYQANKQLRDQCDALKISATYTAKPGGHTGGYWAERIPTHFEFFQQILNLHDHE